MFAKGLVAETESLLARGLEQNPTARQALGYRQVVEHLRGRRSLPETMELVKIRTRQFAKRQLTWFRRQMRLEWISLEGQSAEMAAGSSPPKHGADGKQRRRWRHARIELRMEIKIRVRITTDSGLHCADGLRCYVECERIEFKN